MVAHCYARCLENEDGKNKHLRAHGCYANLGNMAGSTFYTSLYEILTRKVKALPGCKHAVCVA